MYLVTVYNADNGKQVDSKAFPFGKWMEIGLWLDNLGYNGEGFKLSIDFWEKNK